VGNNTGRWPDHRYPCVVHQGATARNLRTKIVPPGGEVVGQINQQLDAPPVISSISVPKYNFESWIAFCPESVDLTAAPPVGRLEDFRVAIEIDDA
jgi:hypothetical protein